jgi:hypothetical protein
MAKRQDDLEPPQQGGERGHAEDSPRGSGIEDIRGIARDEDDEFEDDDLDEPEDDETEDL